MNKILEITQCLLKKTCQVYSREMRIMEFFVAMANKFLYLV